MDALDLLLVVALLGAALGWWRPDWLTRLAGTPASGSTTWRQLRQAGYRPSRAWPILLGARVSLFMLVAAIGWASMGLASLSVAVAVLPIPGLVLRGRTQSRQWAIRRALSYFLDLVVSLLQAGLGLEAAIARAARDGLPPDHPLGAEVTQLVQELRLGRDRTAGFGALAERTGVAELGAVASALAVGLSQGMPVEATLRAQAELARARRREEGLRRLDLANAEVLLPLALCSFPMFFVMVVVPLGLRVLQGLTAVSTR